MSPRKKTDKPFGSKITAPWVDPYTQEQVPISTLPLAEIQPRTQQPRRYFDPEALTELIASVKQHGILQPLLVRKRPSGGYELVAGERRYRAAQEIGLTQVPVYIRDLNDHDAFQLALIENLQREDLNPLE
jgi:ParB family chromosome partitioning protein